MRRLPFPVAFLLTLVWTAACASAESPADGPGGLVLDGATVVGQGAASVAVVGDSITQVGASRQGGTHHDLSGHFLVPGFIDSHVHLAFTPEAAALTRGGIVAAVDWAAPLGTIGEQPMQVVWAGPILTAVDGYPTQGWGANGFGLEIDGLAAGQAAVGQVFDAGARVVKISVGAGGPELPDDVLRAICDEAHRRGMLVGAHALRNADALRAAQVGADILVHAPVSPLSEETVQAWSGKAFIPTISAFSGVESSRQLLAGGAAALYGTDFGNTQALGVSAPEVQGMLDAGMTAAQIIASATSEPASRFGLSSLGTIAAGKEASLLVLDADPLLDPSALTRPVAVLFRGAVVSGALPGLLAPE